MRVGLHFTLSEFGSPPAVSVAGVGALCALFLDPMRSRFGPCTVHSGHRSDAHNRAVGGVANSHHRYGALPLSPAADVTFARGRPSDWATEAVRLSRLYGRGGVGSYPGFVHVDVGPMRRW